MSSCLALQAGKPYINKNFLKEKNPKLKFSDCVRGLQIFIENKDITDRQKCKRSNINMLL